MSASDLGPNPDAVPGAPPPAVSTYRVNGTRLYAEVRGAGPAVLIIPGGGEDAEVWRGVAERLEDRTVVTYDRRGTLRSGREDWPGGGSPQHADDAAALLDALSLGDVTVFGGSSAAIIAMQLAIRHPSMIRRVLAYEPGYFGVLPRGAAFRGPATVAVRKHLERHPGDWPGAYAAFAEAASASAPSAKPAGFLAAPPGQEWYDRRGDLDAEPLVRDDIPIITAETPDAAALAALPTDLRFAHGTDSPAIFREIVVRLAAMRGTIPDVLKGMGHMLYFHPDEAAAYIHGGSAI